MEKIWTDIFDQAASKVVSKTDKNKGAYVLNSEQKDVLESAGIFPTDGPSDRILQISILGSHGENLSVSYYNSIREGANRRPETRMGREIVAWVEVGDLLTIGRIGKQVFFTREASGGDAVPSAEDLGRQLASAVDPALLLAKARRRPGPPAKRDRVVSDFVRNPYVVAAALGRSAGRCEMPQCGAQLFHRDDTSPYLEVHHVVPLAEQGDDSLENAAALCPACHRELHHGRLRREKRVKLAAAIGAKMTG